MTLFPDSPMWPDFMLPFLRWLAVNQIADLLSLLGVVGVLLTFIKVLKSTRAAEAAKLAAEAARSSVQYVTVLADFATGIAILEEIKRFHRSQVLEPLPDRYAALRKLLIAVRTDRIGAQKPSLSEPQRTTIQGAISNLAKAEEAVERALASKTKPDFVRLNKGLSKDLDSLHEILVHLKSLAGDQP
jgi:hypothetical protein